MIIKGSPRTWAVLVFVSLFIPCSTSRLLAQRHCCEGDTWIKWSEDHREDYVRGYILGNAEGYSEACYKITKYWPSRITLGNENNPISRCLKDLPDFSRGPEYFSQRITELYITYPQDRILLITEVLTDLANGKSVKDIHEHPPFPTHDMARTAPAQRNK